jgi:flavin-dependent dehydrogenase
MPLTSENAQYDVIITGAGLAGLTLARQLMLYTQRTVLLLDKREDLPGASQKVGESLVQLGGYYLSKTLDLEEHLLRNHYTKYNLRFHWKTSSGRHDYWDDVSTASIRTQSNIGTFQIDRNLLERHLMEINRQNPRFRFIGGAKSIKIDLAEDDGDNAGGVHKVSWMGGEAAGTWVVDASGRPGILKRSLSLAKPNEIRHGATWAWVDGLVNPELLSKYSHQERLVHRNRQKLGTYPFFLATNHFCGEGRWFWVIPLHGMTSLGLVYDHAVVNPEEVSNGRKMLDWVAKDWPLFADDFKNRKILDEGRFVDFSYDAQQTISPRRWAISGEAGRFSDPLYSPGSDLIAIYNTLIVDAIETRDQSRFQAKCEFYEQIMRVAYESYVPSFMLSYNCLGDPETLTLKYTFELAIYFGFFVLPFTNQLFTNQLFMRTHLRKFALLGPINRNLQTFLRDYFNWKKAQGLMPLSQAAHIDFYDMEPLRASEKLFYEIGLTLEEAEDKLDMHVQRMKEFARHILAHVYAVVLGDKRVLLNAPFVSSLKLRSTTFDPVRMRRDYAPFADSGQVYDWKLNPFALESFIPEQPMLEETTPDR